MTAGYNNGFVVSSNDGNWMLRVNGLMQNRWVLSDTAQDTNFTGLGGAGQDTHHGFETTRAALNFSGTVAKDYHFNMRLNWTPYNGASNVATGNVPGNAELEWAYIQWDLSDQWDIQVGKQKHDVMHSYMVNAENQQVIERSLQTYYWASSSITNGIKLNYDGTTSVPTSCTATAPVTRVVTVPTPMILLTGISPVASHILVQVPGISSARPRARRVPRLVG